MNAISAHFYFENNELKCGGVANALMEYRYADAVLNQWLLLPGKVGVSKYFFGFLALCYDNLNIGDDINKLIPSAELLNFWVLKVFLYSSDFLGEQMLFLSIKALSPVTKLTFERKGFQLAPKHIRTGISLSVAQLQYEYLTIFSASLMRSRQLTCRQSCLLSLSGIRDIRCIVIEQHAQQKELCCITVEHRPPKLSEAFHVAALLTKYLKLPHIVLQQSLSYLFDQLSKYRLSSYCVFEQLWSLPLCKYRRFSAVPFALDGKDVDELFTGSSRLMNARLALVHAGPRGSVGRRPVWDEGYLKRMQEPSLLIKLSRTRALADMSQMLGKYVDSAISIAQFYSWNRALHTIGSSASGRIGRASTTLAPLLDHKFYQSLSTFMVEFFLRQGATQFHVQTGANCYPYIAGIRYEHNSVVDNDSYLATRKAENLHQLGYLSWHKPAVLKRALLLMNVPKWIVSAQFRYSSATIVRTVLYLHKLEQITDHGFN